MGPENIAEGEQAECLAVMRVDGDGPLEQHLGCKIVPGRHLPEMPQPPHHQIPGVEAFRGLAAGPEVLRRVDLRLDGGDDGVGDLVLYRENVFQLVVVTLRPEVSAGSNVTELHGNSHTVAALAYAAVDDIADAEFLGDLLQGYGFALVGEGRIARDDEEPAQLGQSGDEVLANAIGKIFLRRVIAHVGESEDGDRGPIERRQGRWARLESLARRSGDWHRCVA